MISYGSFLCLLAVSPLALVPTAVVRSEWCGCETNMTLTFSTVIARALLVNAAAFQTHEIVSGIFGRGG